MFPSSFNDTAKFSPVSIFGAVYIVYKVGMEKHLEDLTATGHLGAFVGMLTDSRSFLSYPRHHYFRRILCNYLGTMMEKGEMTKDEAFVGKVVQDVCYYNAIRYLNMK